MIWIWLKEKEARCAEFTTPFTYTGGKANLKIAARDKYAVYVNGNYVCNGRGIHDVPAHKSVAQFDLTPFLKNGENNLLIESTYVHVEPEAFPMPSAVAFEVVAEDKILARSDKDTLCRQPKRFCTGDMINDMLGLSLRYDFTAQEEDWQTCRVVETGCLETPKRIQNVTLASPLPSTIVAQGVFAYQGGNTVAQKMQDAWMCTKRFLQMTGKERTQAADLKEPVTFKGDNGDGIFVIADLGLETTGLITFSVTVDKPCRAYLGWGEHLVDLRVRTEINGVGHDRNFAQEFFFKAGENNLDAYLERIGGRYLCLFVETDTLTVKKLSIREAQYPFKKPERDFGDRLLNKIYDVSRRTLELCAHEYYEDCPWREQGLYADGSYQMLFGYSAFEEYEFPRESLRLMAYASRKDGFVELRTPMYSGFTIPAHSAHWLWSLVANAEADFDEAFVKEMLPYAEKILSSFQKRTNETGITVFVEPEYWNWHDWIPGLGTDDFIRTEYIPEDADGVMTAIICRLAKGIADLEEKCGNAKKAEELREYSLELQEKIENFYDEEKGLYASFIRQNGKEGYHAYTQAMVILAKDLPKEKAAYICDCLKNPDGKMYDVGLGTLVWKYDAIIKCENNPAWCVEDICRIFSPMVFGGATSFWETPYGEADFLDAGSLCHAWASVACHIFTKYLPQK